MHFAPTAFNLPERAALRPEAS